MINLEIKILLKDVLEARNIDKKQLSEMTGISVRTISNLCNNNLKSFSIKDIGKIAAALDIKEPNEIFGLTVLDNEEKM